MKKLIASTAAAALLTLGLVAAAAAPASATTDSEVCVPADAWTEIIEHPAVGEPTITVPNPEYVPAVPEQSHVVTHPAVTEVVHHPAETQVVHHEAETHTEYHFAKFTREKTREKGSHGWGDWSGYGEWSKYSPETQTSWELSDAPLGSPQFHSSGNHGKNVQWERQWQALFDGQTRVIEDKAAYDETVVVKEAYDETVVIKEAWDETIIDVPGQPAIGEPTKTVPNPDYVAPRTETIEHPAVECPPAPANPTATLTAVCGEATLVFTNPFIAEAEQLTASFVVNVDGVFYGAFVAEAGAHVTETITFAEDTGSHRVEVYQAGTSEWKLIASGDVTSDCILPPVDPEEPEEPVTPTTPEQPKPIVKTIPVTAKVATSEVDETLATTGGAIDPLMLGGAAALLALGGALVARRRHAHNN